MLRTHTCGSLRITDKELCVTLCGWAHKIRNKGGIVWIDLRDRYGVTQLVLEEGITPVEVINTAKDIGREFVLSVSGTVLERQSKNNKLPTGDVELRVENLVILNESKIPPFTIESETDGGIELRMKYRYLDLRRKPLQDHIILKHNIMQYSREYLNKNLFLEIETPTLIKSTPEGSRDFVSPSRMQPGFFYALPQSPQLLKQLLMISGFDRYYQFAKCFRDEDLRAERQQEFMQLDCEMTFVTQENIIEFFEGLLRFILEKVKQIHMSKFERLTYSQAIKLYGTDKPDLRFGMPFVEITHLAKGSGFTEFDNAELIVGFCVHNSANFYTRKKLDELADFLSQSHPEINELVYVKCESHDNFSSSVGKIFNKKQLGLWAAAMNAKPGDMLLILAGKCACKTRTALSDLRLRIGTDLGLRDVRKIAPLWITDFPLLEKDKETKKYHAMHHPFTSPKEDEMDKLENNPEAVFANSYDLVINGHEIGGGSIRNHKRNLQEKIFEIIGIDKSEALEKFGFFLEALDYGAPPHGGIAVGLDRLCMVLMGEDSIRSFIPFPKNNNGRDVMLDSPSRLSNEQLSEIGLKLV